MAPHCFTRPWIRDNEETSSRSKSLSKVEIKLATVLKMSFGAVANCWQAPGTCLRVSNQLYGRFGHVDSAWGYRESICSSENGQ